MERMLLKELKKWKEDKKRKPLILKGARQVGKTWLMKEFGKKEFKKVAYVNFFNNDRMKTFFSVDYDIKRLITGISAETGIEITPNDTLIIFDEIQECPKALESLKFFYENAPEFAIISAGSLLGVAIHKDISYPVGKVCHLTLYPMNFKEFLLAQKENKLVEFLENKDFSLINSFADKFLFHLKNYFFTGGMPEPVLYFVEHSDFSGTRKIQEEILIQYKNDFGKHISSSELPRINMVWDSIPIQLAKENKKFFFGQIKKGARASEYEKAIQWLLDCGLVYKVYKVKEPRVPLSFYKDLTSFKLFMLDTGLLGALSGLDAKTLLEGSALFVKAKGAFAEQYVFQELISETNYIPYYFSSETATFEQDFLIQNEKNVIPIEVKFGKNIHSQSLKAYSKKYNPEVAIRFSELPYIEQEIIKNIPLYAICCL